jgi:hypothetical protein
MNSSHQEEVAIYFKGIPRGDLFEQSMYFLWNIKTVCTKTTMIFVWGPEKLAMLTGNISNAHLLWW